MSIESLKQQARRHEQDEEWQKALDQYLKAIKALAEDDQTDIGLINRVGDLYVRVGKLDDAVKHYEQAVDLYREAFLPNNAIAVCKKIIRNVPDRHQAYLKIGQIRAEQGFLPDARENFLTYAERMQQDGDLDESFRALVEFCDLAPDDVGVRVTVAEQMAANDRQEEAIEQFLVAYRNASQSGDSELAETLEAKIHELDPSADVGAAAAVSDAGFGGGLDEVGGDFGDIEFGATVEAPEAAPVAADEDEGEAGFSIASEEVGASLEDALEEEAGELPGFDIEGEEEEEDEGFELPTMDFGGEEEEEEEGAFELPTMDFGGEEEEEEEAPELPTMDFGGDEEEEEEAPELPTMDFGGDEEEEEEEAPELPTMDFGGGEEEDEEAPELPTMDFGGEEEAPVQDEAGVLDAGSTETPSMAAEAVEESMEEAAAEAPVAEEAVEAAPVAPAAEPEPPAEEEPAEEFVDLGAMILGGADKKSTRFKVAYEEPSGDEEADFAKMLSQFKEKVSENLDSSDVKAHHDLGTAYKEMGLLQEAISSFQAALRAAPDHLPTYELMGQTFIEMGQPEAAVRTLQRALEVKSRVEDELVGIYYYLARAYEALQEKESAVEYYDRVFALDINFADVTERLRELR